MRAGSRKETVKRAQGLRNAKVGGKEGVTAAGARRSRSPQPPPGSAPRGLRSPPAMESGDGGGGGRGPAGREEPPLGEAREEEEETEALPPPEAEPDWSFAGGEMEAVVLQDLPTATIACNLDPRVFQDGQCRVRAARRAALGRLPLPARSRRSARPAPAPPPRVAAAASGCAGGDGRAGGGAGGGGTGAVTALAAARGAGGRQGAEGTRSFPAKRGRMRTE